MRASRAACDIATCAIGSSLIPYEINVRICRLDSRVPQPFCPRKPKPAHKRSLLLISGEKLSFVRGFLKKNGRMLEK